MKKYKRNQNKWEEKQSILRKNFKNNKKVTKIHLVIKKTKQKDKQLKILRVN